MGEVYVIMPLHGIARCIAAADDDKSCPEEQFNEDEKSFRNPSRLRR